MWTMLRVLGLLMGWSVLGVVQADTVSLTAPDGLVLRIEPGASGVLRMRVQGTQVISGGLYFGYAPGEYSASAAATGCPALEPMTNGRPVSFNPTVAGGDLLCEYNITRQATSINDLSARVYVVGAEPDHSSVDFHFGAVPPLSMSTRQESAMLLPDGRARGIMRVSLGNYSSHSITVLNAGSCLAGVAPFSFDGSIPGGCGDMSLYAGLCFTGGAYGLELRPFPANTATSCLVELTTYQPYTVPVSFPIEVVTDYLSDAASGGQLSPPQMPARTLSITLDLIFADGLD